MKRHSRPNEQRTAPDKKISSQPNEEGSALVIAMLIVLLTATFIAVASMLTSETSRRTDSSRDFSVLRSAAEGALEFGYGVWGKTINSYYRPITTAQMTTALSTVPSFTGLSYASSANNGPLQVNALDDYGQPMSSTAATPIPARVNLDTYPGWTGYTSNYLASVRLLGNFAGNRTVQYGVKRTLTYSDVPLFQATAFFEGDLELYRTAPMTIGGLVHTNSQAYVSSGSPGVLTFTGNLSYVSGYTDSTEPPYADTWSGYVPNSTYTPTYPSGIGSQVNQVQRMEPLGTSASSILSTTDTNPNNDSMRELIEPPDTAYSDPAPIAQRRLYNKAGILIHMTPTVSRGVTTYTESVTTQNGTTLTPTQINTIKTALTQQTFYDRREGQNIDVSSLNVSAVLSTLNAAAGFNNIIYIDQTNSDGTISTSNPQGIRLTNGANLPTNGLTVASQNPVYIEGNFNTSGGQPPSAVFADAVTILSNNWSDSNSSAALSYRQAGDTTVNTAIVAGFIPSGWTNPNTGVQYGYSGGLNNFPRFLEDWTNNNFTYNGSMISLFTSQVAIGEWDTGNIYAPPNRIWNFDPTFTNNPPPGSVDAVSLARGAISRF